VKHGLFFPPFGELSDPRRVAELAVKAEAAGWSGFFLWDHMLATPGLAVGDAWTAMAAVAAATSEIRFGAMVTPLSRRRPWVLARQVAALDLLSGGRFVVGIGLGDDGWKEFSSFGEVTAPRERGLLLDESLEILRLLLSGQDVAYDGERLAVAATPFLPRPVQDPVPVWVACRWPNRKPLARAAAQQGCFPIFAGSPDMPPAGDLSALRADLRRRGAGDGYDLVVRCQLRRLDPAHRPGAVAAAADSGVTWLLEGFDPGVTAADFEAVVTAGPVPVRLAVPEKTRAGTVDSRVVA
jgi:alkanesulfonate monooxygenase SsuD/methylene tetrahydromethanopterin reductase-like flavin-dependent oxidoreductase (luciferase family)